MKDYTWRPVPGFENYEISIDVPEGLCRATNYMRRGITVVLKNTCNPKTGRISWRLWKNGEPKLSQAARWIAITYPELVDGEWFEGAEIDHKDANRLNNQPSNLKWTDRKGNANNPNTRQNKKKAFKGIMKNHKSISKAVEQYSINGTLIKTYPSAHEASRQTGFIATNISACCRGESMTSHGFIWKYAS